MIVAQQKLFDDIYRMIRRHDSVMVLGCGTCTSVCMAGGDRQATALASQLRIAAQQDNNALRVHTTTIERQCDGEFVDAIIEKARNCEAVLSMACGAGVQLVADKLEPIPVYPALDSKFVGTSESVGHWSERCSLCGECILDRTGGICPVTTCPKGLLNGPCGGAHEGMCEVDPEKECAWARIYRRLEVLGQLDKLETIYPPPSHSRHTSPQHQDNKTVTLPPHQKDSC